MAVDIESIFKATAQSSRSFLITNGQGCYIPAYQRPYSWGVENVDRLFEDALHGLNLLKKRENTISFLGTVIAIHDTKHVTVQPIFKAEMPSKVMTIIDGQQRISTFLMINIAIHHLASTLLKKLDKQEGEHQNWLSDQVETLIADLFDTLLIDMKTGDKEYRYYPRLIRSYEDVWSKRKGQAKYQSPICRLIWDYKAFLETEGAKTFKYEPKDKSGNVLQQFGVSTDTFRLIQRRIVEITGKKWDENDFPEVLEIAQTESFSNAIWGYEIPEQVVTYLRDEHAAKGYAEYCQLFRLLVFSKYLNDRMAFTVVTAENEDDAFDMFEALNTTGEPLTAYETFKPKVIEAEGVSAYEQSVSINYVEDIEEYLDRFKRAEEKQRATSEMLVPFALSETGEKLQKRLVDQRRYLREQFDSQLSSLEERQQFVCRLSHVAQFMKCIWKNEDPRGIFLGGSALLGDRTETSLLAIRDLNHHIVVAPLSRFFGEVLRAKDEPELRKAKEAELASAIRATVSFSIIWRAALGGTAGIDSRYRAILSEKVNGQLGPLAARPKSGVGSVSLSNYKKALLHFLDEAGLGQKEEWVKRVAKAPIYKQKTLARFLLFAASEDATPDSKDLGLVVQGRPGLLPMLTPKNWNNKDYLTVEHIAPQSGRSTWDQKIYEDPETVDILGNLTLLPMKENSMVGNKEWKHKKALYQVLSAQDQQEFDKYKEKFASVGLALNGKTEEVLAQASYLPLCRSVGQRTGDWDLEFIRKRSERLSELAWVRMRAWID